MSNDAGDGGFVPPDGADVDPGQPVSGLDELEIEPSAGFLHRLRNKIDRRTLTSQILSLAWDVPKMVLFEFLDMVFYFLGPADERKGGTR